MTAAETYALQTQQESMYGRDSCQRIAELIQADDVLATILQTFRTNPTLANAELIALHLSGMQRAANQLTLVISRESKQ